MYIYNYIFNCIYIYTLLKKMPNMVVLHVYTVYIYIYIYMHDGEKNTIMHTLNIIQPSIYNITKQLPADC